MYDERYRYYDAEPGPGYGRNNDGSRYYRYYKHYYAAARLHPSMYDERYCYYDAEPGPGYGRNNDGSRYYRYYKHYYAAARLHPSMYDKRYCSYDAQPAPGHGRNDDGPWYYRYYKHYYAAARLHPSVYDKRYCSYDAQPAPGHGRNDDGPRYYRYYKHYYAAARLHPSVHYERRRLYDPDPASRHGHNDDGYRFGARYNNNDYDWHFTRNLNNFASYRLHASVHYKNYYNHTSRHNRNNNSAWNIACNVDYPATARLHSSMYDERYCYYDAEPGPGYGRNNDGSRYYRYYKHYYAAARLHPPVYDERHRRYDAQRAPGHGRNYYGFRFGARYDYYFAASRLYTPMHYKFPGTTTVTPLPDCTHPCTTSVIITASPLPLNCSVSGFLAQQAGSAMELYGVDLITGEASLINGNMDTAPWAGVNAIGYNVMDNYIYGATYTSSLGPGNLIRIGAGGETLVLPISMPFFTTCGDVAPDGQFYILGAEGTGSTPAWAQIDLSDSSSPSYGNVVARGNTRITQAVRDWAYVPGAGNFLWTYADTGASPNVVGLFRWDLTTHAFTGVRNLFTISYTSHIGAVYASADGYLYGSDNVSGRIYRVNVTSSQPYQLVSSGPRSGGNDGARCVNALDPISTTTAITQPTDTASPLPLNCSVSGFLAQQAGSAMELYGVDLLTGEASLINGNMDTAPWAGVNAIGYNVMDNYIYGATYTSSLGRGNLIRIGAGGNTLVLPIPIPFFTTCGDVAPDGQFYILGAEGTGSTPAWAQIDLSDSSSPSYGNVVDSGNTRITQAVRDWAYVPGAGNFLWTYADTGASPNVVGLFRWDLTTHAFTGVRNLFTISYTSHIGAVYASADGYLYGSDNVSGRIYRVNVTGSEPFELVSTGPQSGGNDGARCVNALAPISSGSSTAT
ncbi:hypothetical protein DCS_03341 [Drechmeria coniospora]|uniref:DUF6923 domain-containing protein n=1 Tax=Drechmeria coniospora TaxID=98403 RepID=A0A151GGW4_DRECN|nr:hypothetical protein DCS_03341 [Drechmeria coniospora]KYK56343.1 hypothetical protein DCS_03341 [Drechmeria coniospora]